MQKYKIDFHVPLALGGQKAMVPILFALKTKEKAIVCRCGERADVR
jgi:hypothetical protein